MVIFRRVRMYHLYVALAITSVGFVFVTVVIIYSSLERGLLTPARSTSSSVCNLRKYCDGLKCVIVTAGSSPFSGRSPFSHLSHPNPNPNS